MAVLSENRLTFGLGPGGRLDAIPTTAPRARMIQSKVVPWWPVPTLWISPFNVGGHSLEPLGELEQFVLNLWNSGRSRRLANLISHFAVVRSCQLPFCTHHSPAIPLVVQHAENRLGSRSGQAQHTDPRGQTYGLAVLQVMNDINGH